MVILGLGSNQGDRLRHLKDAARELAALLEELRCSSVYESTALLPEGAPADWNMPFLNMAVRGSTELAPSALLGALKDIERRLGRKARGHWGPREIDIDILAYAERIIVEPGLAIPHKELLQRDFALVPLAELAPSWVHPVAGRPAGELAAGIHSSLAKTNLSIL